MRQRLREGSLLGSFVNIPHPSAVEILGRAGFEVLCLDSEHSSFDMKDIAEGIRAAEVAGAFPLVRVAGIGPQISQVLDAGAVGVVVPRVSSAEDARAAAALACFPPHGERGVGLGRAGAYGQNSRYWTDRDRGSYVIVQIETAAGLASVDSICAVAGLDMVMVGPFDLAASMNEEVWSETHSEAVGEILRTARSHGLATCLFVTSPGQLSEFSSHKVDLFLLSSDVLMLAQGAALMLRQ